MKIVHVSNTDIRSDYRIIRQIKSLKSYDITAIGIEDFSETHKTDLSSFCSYIVIQCKKNDILPKVLVHFFNLIIFNIKLLLKLISLKPNLIHVHDTYPLMAAVIYKIFYDVYIIYDCHELESDKAGQSKFFSAITYLIEFIFYRKCDCLITVSLRIEKWYISTFGRLSYHAVIYNSPVIDDNLVQDDVLLSEKEYENENKLRFVYVGQFSQDRNIESLLEFFSNTHHELHLIGWGFFENLILDYSKKYNNIYLYAPLPNEKLISFLKCGSFDFGLCMLAPCSLSDKYSLPNKLFEYTFCNINVIASNFPEISHYIAKTNSGYCYDSIDDFYCELKSNKVIKKQIRNNVLTEYSSKNMDAKLNLLYSKLIQGEN